MRAPDARGVRYVAYLRRGGVLTRQIYRRLMGQLMSSGDRRRVINDPGRFDGFLNRAIARASIRAEAVR